MNALAFIRSLATGVTEVSTQSQLQAALNAVAAAEPNIQGGTAPNHSKAIIIRGMIPISSNSPLNWPGNAVVMGYSAGGGISYTGSATPPILYYSAVGNGQTADMVTDNLTIYAPNAPACWGWNAAQHAGNAGNYTYRNMKLTAAGVHINTAGPGSDRRFYEPRFDNIRCFGVGQGVGGLAVNYSVLPGGGTPIIGTFDHIKYLGHCNYSHVINLDGAYCAFRFSWIEPSGNGFIKTTGSFGLLTWESYTEEDGVNANPLYSFDGYNNRVIADLLFFISPDGPVTLTGGAKLTYRGTDIGVAAGGVAVDMTKLTNTSPSYASDLQTIRNSFNIDSTSSMSWTGGYYNSEGLVLYNKTAT